MLPPAEARPAGLLEQALAVPALFMCGGEDYSRGLACHERGTRIQLRAYMSQSVRPLLQGVSVGVGVGVDTGGGETTCIASPRP